MYLQLLFSLYMDTDNSENLSKKFEFGQKLIQCLIQDNGVSIALCSIIS